MAKLCSWQRGLNIKVLLLMNDSLNLEFDGRFRKAKQAMGMLKTVWSNHHFSLHIKVKIYITMVTTYMGMNFGKVQ